MIIIILLVIFLFLSFPASTMLVNSSKWKYYKTIYKTLKNKTFYITKDYNYPNAYMVYSDDWQVIYFNDKKHIKLKEEVYLFNHWVSFLDLYSLYWYFKYFKFFKKYKEQHFTKK